MHDQLCRTTSWQVSRCHTGQMEESHLIGGIEHREIVLVANDEQWPDQFREHQARIARALGPIAVRIEHVGSTAISGLSAKPIIDIQVSVAHVEDEDSYLPDLLNADYLLRVREPGHRMVRTSTLDVHVHICEVGSDWERRHLLFRDWLRRDTHDREAYERLKRELSRKEWADMNDYAEAKGPLISDITQRAESWARASNWNLPDA